MADRAKCRRCGQIRHCSRGLVRNAGCPPAATFAAPAVWTIALGERRDGRGHLEQPEETSMESYEKLGAFYLGRPYDLGAASARRRPAALRLQGPDDPRRLRRHDRQRQDRAVRLGLLEEAAIDGIPAHRHRSQGRPGQPAADLPGARGRRTSGPGSTRTRRARKGLTPDEYAAAAGRAVAQGPGRVGPGRRAHPAAARGGGRRDLHAGQRAPGCRSRSCCARSPRRRRRCSRTATRCASGSRATVSGLLGLLGHRRRPDPQPRAHPALDDPRRTPGARAATSTSAA